MIIYCIYAELESEYPTIIECYKTYEEAVKYLKNIKDKFKNEFFSYEEDELIMNNDDLYMIIETELKEKI